MEEFKKEVTQIPADLVVKKEGEDRGGSYDEDSWILESSEVVPKEETNESGFDHEVKEEGEVQNQVTEKKVGQQHQEVDGGGGGHCCKICEADFSSKWKLRSHVGKVHAKKKCKSCCLAVTSSKDLQLHFENGHIDEPYECEYCSYKTDNITMMKLHTDSVHLKVKPYECEICGSRFSQKNSVKIHANAVHHGLKPHKCTICTANFSHKQHLQIHENAVHKK